jgi:hypothetical protein
MEPTENRGMSSVTRLISSRDATHARQATHDTDGVPPLLDEREAASLLRVKPSTVRAERIRGKLGLYSNRRAHLLHPAADRGLSRTTVGPAMRKQSIQHPGQIGDYSVRSHVAIARTIRGAEPGMTTALDRHAVSALAQQTFRRQASGSRPGSSTTNAPAKRLRTKF